MSDKTCPLCRASRPAKKFMPLYGAPVCRKCYYKFANRRQLAYLLDWLVFNTLALVAGTVFTRALIQWNVAADASDIILFSSSWIVFPMLFFMKDGFAGQSLGKLVAGVQAIDRETFEPIGFGRSLVRNLPLIVPLIPLIIALMLQRGYRWGDGWAKSKVIWKRYANHPVFTGRLACENCQYDLTGNTTGICPECGASVASLPPPAAPPISPGMMPIR